LTHVDSLSRDALRATEKKFLYYSIERARVTYLGL